MILFTIVNKAASECNRYLKTGDWEMWIICQPIVAKVPVMIGRLTLQYLIKWNGKEGGENDNR